MNRSITSASPSSLVDNKTNLDTDARNEQGRTALYRAVESRISLSVENCLARGDDPNQPGPRGRTPLHCAVADRPKLEIVKRLLTCPKIQLDKKDDDGCTALHLASEGGHLQIVECLVKQGAIIDAKNNEGKSAKKMALEKERLEIALFLAQNSNRRGQGFVRPDYFKTMELLNGDIMRLRPTAEWKHDIALEPYKNSLKVAEDQADVALQICCLKKCGDTWRKEAEYRLNNFDRNQMEQVKDAYQQAIGYYNEAIALCEQLPNDLKERRREPKRLMPKGLLLQRLEELETSYIQKVLRRESLSEGVKIEARRERLAEMRAEAKAELNRGSKAQVILKEITKKSRALVQDLIGDCFAILGSPACSYAIMGCGSMSRKEMCFYSDVELVVLLKEDTPQNRNYFSSFINLLWFKIMMVGENGNKMHGAVKGFRLDENNASIYKDFLNTPEQMARDAVDTEKMRGLQGLKEQCVISDFLGACSWVDGDPELVNSFENAVRIRLEEVKEERKVRELKALQELQEDLKKFKPILGEKRETPSIFDVKKDLYRLPSQIVNKLCLYYGIEKKNTWERLEALKNGSFINATSCERLSELIEKIARLRLRVHAHYKTEEERIWHSGVEQPEEETAPAGLFELTLQDIEILKEIYEVFIPLHKTLETFCRAKGNTDILKEHFLPNVTLIEQAEIHESQFEYKEAREGYEQALGLKPEDSSVLLKLGNVLFRLGEYKEAKKKYKKALRITREELGDNDPNVANILYNLGQVFHVLGTEQEAVKEYYEPALTIMREQYGENNISLVPVLMDLGRAKKALGKEEEAVAHYKQALNIYRASQGVPLTNAESDDLDVIIEQVKIVKKLIREENLLNEPMILNHLGEILYNLDRKEMALSNYCYRLKVKAIYERALDIDQGSQQGKILENLAGALCAFGEYKEALERYEEVLHIYKSTYGEEHPETARIFNKQGEVLQNLFRNKEAIISHKRARNIYEAHSDYGRHHPRVAEVLNNSGRAWSALGYHKEAIEERYDLALLIYKEHYGEAHPVVAETLNNLGATKKALEQYPEARNHHNNALTIYTAHYRRFHPCVAETLNHLGQIEYTYDRRKEARRYYDEALKVYKGHYGESHPRIAETLSHLGEVQLASDQVRKAEASFLQALGMYRILYGEHHPRMADALNNLSNVYTRLGNNQEAERLRNLASEIRRENPRYEERVSFEGRLDEREEILLTIQSRKPVIQDAVKKLLKNDSTDNVKMDLISEAMDHVDAFVLAEALKYNTVLQELNLSDNHIDDQGIEDLARVLTEHNTTLRTLHLGRNGIGDLGVNALIEVLQKNKNLQLTLQQSEELTRQCLPWHVLANRVVHPAFVAFVVFVGALFLNETGIVAAKAAAVAAVATGGVTAVGVGVGAADGATGAAAVAAVIVYCFNDVINTQLNILDFPQNRNVFFQC